MRNKANAVKGGMALDSLLALTLLASVLSSWVIFTEANIARKNAHKLAAETITYARIYAQYMVNTRSSIVNTLRNGNAYVLTPELLLKDGKWNTDLETLNVFKQKPCVVIVPNSKSANYEAVMYYVGGVDMSSHKLDFIMRQARILLGGSGGIFKAGEIEGNSGWNINASSPFLTNSSLCGGAPSNNSLAVNLDLMPEWNQTMQPFLAIAKEEDNGQDIRKKPGHMVNYNTLKTDLVLPITNGVILDNSDSNNPVKLQMAYGNGSNIATLGLYSNNKQINTKTVAASLEPIQAGVSGDSCENQEVGKIIVDRGKITTGQYLSRSTLVCSDNKMLCNGVNASHTCYLPVEANQIVFQNNVTGIQNATGNFVCPGEMPFALNSEPKDLKVIQGDLSGYLVNIGYYLKNGGLIKRVTCSNMPDYAINAIPQSD